MAKNIRNYTSEQDAMTSMMKIEQMILNAGGRNITKIFDDNQNCTAINFILPVNGMQTPFILESKIDLVYAYMIKQFSKIPTAAQMLSTRKQAAKTAWKNLFELLQIQLDMVAIEQVELMQVLLPLLSDGKQTFYAKLKENKFKQLTQ